MSNRVAALAGDPAASRDEPSQPKRKRASKPKVRTGCITCKIRRVKCGEERPACVRCTSTGRTCDGYDKAAAPSRFRTQESQQAASELARKEFLKAYQWNEALRTMRPIVADITGSDLEKRFFHRFRNETADGMTAHVCNFSNFWSRVAPQVSHSSEAVKHAVIALGAAHELFTFPNAREICGQPRDRVEIFMIKQYNESIKKLSHHVSSTSSDSIHVTIVCCLIFICLETLRQNHQGAVAHLINGLKILQSLPRTALAFLAETDPWRPGQNASFDIEETARLFSRMEISASFASGIRPTLCERGYSYRRYWTGESEPPLEDLQAAHRAVCVIARDSAARLYETMHTADPAAFWADPQQVEQQRCMRVRVDNLAQRLVEFQERVAPQRDSPEYLYIHLDRTHVACIKMMVQFMDENARKSGAPIPEPERGPVHERNATTIEVMNLVSMIQRCGTGKSWLRRKDEGRRSFVTDTGVRGPLYIVTIGARNERLRKNALSMLVRDGGREGFWDGQEALYGMVMKRAEEMREEAKLLPGESKLSSGSATGGEGDTDGSPGGVDLSESDFDLEDALV